MMLKTDFDVSIVDYNAYSAPAEGKEAKYQYGPAGKKSKPETATTPKALVEATGTNTHSVFVENWSQVLQGTGSKPAEASALIDAGAVLPNINDGYKGKAPDIGLIEYGEEEPKYGPRKP